jgi:phage shock protein PspC (stress-responsive transcriptional regulator)
MAKRLYRSNRNSVIAGVCGGIGEYFDIDPVMVRIIAVLLLLAKGVGLIAYVVAWIAMPVRPADEPVRPAPKSEISKYLPGIILIALGVIFLVDNLFWWFHFGYIWPLGLVAIGVILVFKSLNDRKKEEEDSESIQS